MPTKPLFDRVPASLKTALEKWGWFDLSNPIESQPFRIRSREIARQQIYDKYLTPEDLANAVWHAEQSGKPTHEWAAHRYILNILKERSGGKWSEEMDAIQRTLPTELEHFAAGMSDEQRALMPDPKPDLHVIPGGGSSPYTPPKLNVLKNAGDELKAFANPATLASMAIPYKFSAPIFGAMNIANDKMPVENMPLARAAGLFSGLVPFLEDTGLGKAVSKTVSDLATNIAKFDPKDAGNSLMRFAESGVENLKEMGSGWAEAPISNTLNMTGLFSTKMPEVSQTAGAVKYSHGLGGVPVFKDPITGVDFGPSSTVYFGRDPVERTFNVMELGKALESGDLNIDRLIAGVPFEFGAGVPGQRGKLIDPFDYLPGFNEGMRTAFNNVNRNVADALSVIPTASRTNVIMTPQTGGALGRYTATSDVARINPFEFRTIHGTVPHELGHSITYNTDAPLFSTTAKKHYHSNPTFRLLDNMDVMVDESRSELLSKRFQHWLRTNGQYHYWDQPGSIGR